MLKIEGLTREHDRKGFDCGESELNDFLRKTARQHIEKGISRTFVLVDTDRPAEIIGFFTLVSCEVAASDLPPRYAKKYLAGAPAAKLARLAVSTGRQREGLGTLMMADAIKRTLAVAENIGIIGFFVDAKNEGARRYYEQYGFIPLHSSALELFLPLATLKKAQRA